MGISEGLRVLFSLGAIVQAAACRSYWAASATALIILMLSLQGHAALFQDFTESVEWIPTTFNGYDSRQSVYTVGPIYNEVSNACYLITAQYEISNIDPKHAIMVGQTIIRHADPSDTRGLRVTPATTTNVDRDRHHEHWNGSIVECPPVGVWYYSLNVYSGLRKAIKPAIRLEQGYGFIQAFRIK